MLGSGFLCHPKSEGQPRSAPQALCWVKAGLPFVLSTSGPRELQQPGLFPQVAEGQAAFVKSDTSRQTTALFPHWPQTQLCGTVGILVD